MDNALADIITKQGAPMRQQPPGTSPRFSYQPLQLRERGYGEEEIELALVPLILEFVRQRLEVVEVRLNENKQNITNPNLSHLPPIIQCIYPTLASLSRWQDSLATTEYFLRAHVFYHRISDEVRSAGMQGHRLSEFVEDNCVR